MDMKLLHSRQENQGVSMAIRQARISETKSSYLCLRVVRKQFVTFKIILDIRSSTQDHILSQQQFALDHPTVATHI
jgi:hypothetical protein